MQDDEQVRMQDDEQAPMQDSLMTNEQQKLTQDDEQVPMQDDEQVLMQDDEQVPMQDDEQVPMQDDEQAPMQDGEQVPMQDDEQVPTQDSSITNEQQELMQHDEEVQVRMPPYTSETDVSEGIPCYLCNAKAGGWGKLMDHIRKYHKIKMGAFRGTFFHAQALLELNTAQHERYTKKIAARAKSRVAPGPLFRHRCR